MDGDGIIELMRTLHRHGVTHFVVKPELHNRLQRNMDAKGKFTQGEKHQPVCDGGDLYFRGRRILKQEDLQHLPFDPNKYESITYESRQSMLAP